MLHWNGQDSWENIMVYILDGLVHPLSQDFFHKGSKVNQSSMMEVKQVSCYATSMLYIELFHKGSKGESVKSGGGKTTDLTCNA